MNDEFIDLENESEVGDLLKKLEKGQEVKARINGQEITYSNPPEPLPICEKHEFEDVGDEGNGYRAAKCRNCINGRIFDPKTHEVVNGEVRLLSK
ncbi:MAG: hypothetical protein H0U60_19940 [Blastocatellia bacterium]|nr:hypothetical protein [Blastocatellia bacterium]